MCILLFTHLCLIFGARLYLVFSISIPCRGFYGIYITRQLSSTTPHTSPINSSSHHPTTHRKHHVSHQPSPSDSRSSHLPHLLDYARSCQLRTSNSRCSLNQCGHEAPHLRVSPCDDKVSLSTSNRPQANANHTEGTSSSPAIRWVQCRIARISITKRTPFKTNWPW